MNKHKELYIRAAIIVAIVGVIAFWAGTYIHPNRLMAVTPPPGTGPKAPVSTFTVISGKVTSVRTDGMTVTDNVGKSYEFAFGATTSVQVHSVSSEDPS